MEEYRLAKETAFLNQLQLGLDEYAKQYSGICPAESVVENCTLEVIHRENGMIVILTAE